MACRRGCLCQCHQSGCGCNERPKPFVANRPGARQPETKPEKVTSP